MSEKLVKHVDDIYDIISAKNLQIINAGEDVWRKGNPPTMLWESKLVQLL